MFAVALPNAFLGDPEYFLGLAAGALYDAVRPAKAKQESFAILEFSKVDNGFLKSLRRFHVMIMRLWC